MKAASTSAGRAKPRQSGQLESAFRTDKSDTQVVSALSRGLALLDSFNRKNSILGNAELARRTGLTKSTVSRLTYTLALQGYLTFDPRSREYRLGPQVISLGAIALATTNLRTLALPLMQRLAKGSNFNVGLGTRDDLQMVYTDAAEGNSLISLRLFPGSRIPLATSAMGRAYLAACASEEREETLERLRPRYGDDWGRVLKGVQDALKEQERHGFCSSMGDWQKDINGVASPIRVLHGSARYVLNLGGPAYALPERDLRERHAPELVAIAREVEAALLGDCGSTTVGSQPLCP